MKFLKVHSANHTLAVTADNPHPIIATVAKDGETITSFYQQIGDNRFMTIPYSAVECVVSDAVNVEE